VGGVIVSRFGRAEPPDLPAREYADALPTVAPWTEIEPATGLFRGLNLKELWAYREVVVALSVRQLRVRYKQTLLGVGWVLIQPLVGVVVFTLVFGNLAGFGSEGFPYPVFVVTGLVVWNYFSAAVTMATTRLVADRELITKVYFPRVLAPLASTLPPLIDLAVGMIVVAALLIAYDVTPGAAIVLLPLWICCATTLAFAAGMMLSALNVRYRDVGNAIAFVVQFWFFVTPIVFASSQVTGVGRVLLACNPVTGLVDAVRWSVLGAPAPPPVDLISLASGAALLFVGLLYFQRVERAFADLV
jgi:ABC-type polysaccharide/polyol phosphate export permease